MCCQMCRKFVVENSTAELQNIHHSFHSFKSFAENMKLFIQKKNTFNGISLSRRVAELGSVMSWVERQTYFCVDLLTFSFYFGMKKNK